MIVSKALPPRTIAPAVWTLFVIAVAVAMVAAGHTGQLVRNARVSDPVATATMLRAAASAQQRSHVVETLGALPLAFEANQGQTDPEVKYLARSAGYTVYLTPTETVFALRASSSPSASSARRALRPDNTNKRPAGGGDDGVDAIRMRLAGANQAPEIATSGAVSGKVNYFRGNDPSRWQASVPQFARVSYESVYPGIDVTYHGAQRQMEFDFEVAAGADVKSIALSFTGTKKITTDSAGNLIVSSQAGGITFHRPVAYQEQGGVRQPVSADFALKSDNEVGFQIGAYDRSRELVIDPSVTYATYLGGTAEDDAYAVAFDSSGNAYVTGQTKSGDFPTKNALHGSNAGGFDVFVTELSASGSSLVYSTYIGGSSDDSGNAIAVDASGDAFVAGGTDSSDFPTKGAFQSTFGGGGVDAFVLELGPGGSVLLYSTFLGGTGSEAVSGIALDSGGNAYVAGYTTSTNFPPMNPIQSTPAGGFVTKLNSSGNALDYSTYIGGGPNDFAAGIAVDANDVAYVTGATSSKTFTTTAGVVQPTCGSDGNCNGGLYDAFVSVINKSGSGFVYSTFLGGEANDEGLGIAADGSGDAYVTGFTSSPTKFPLKSPLQPTFGGGTLPTDAFVTELNPTGTALVYSTYLGGSGDETGTAIAVDSNQNAYITGQTASSDFPSANPTQAQKKGQNDAFVSEISTGGSALIFSTYLGGSLNENTSAANGGGAIGAIAVEKTGANIYVAGNTISTDFPTVSAEQSTAKGTGDAFVAKFAQAVTPDFSISAGALSPSSVAQGGSATSAVTVAPLFGYSNNVNLTCSVAGGGSPAPTCALSSATISGGSGTSTATIHTTGATGALVHPSKIFYALWMPVVGLSLIGMRLSTAGTQRNRLLGFLLLGTVMAMLFVLPACGGSGGGGGGGGGCTGCTPTGNYTITVTGSDGTLSHTSNTLTLTVN